MSNQSADKKQVIAESFDLGASVYDKAPFFGLFGRRLVDLAELQPGAKVLDVATGTGAALLPAAEQAGNEGYVEGIDISEAMAVVARDAISPRLSQATCVGPRKYASGPYACWSFAPFGPR